MPNKSFPSHAVLGSGVYYGERKQSRIIVYFIPGTSSPSHQSEHLRPFHSIFNKGADRAALLLESLERLASVAFLASREYSDSLLVLFPNPY